jgi:hypothetical protein
MIWSRQGMTGQGWRAARFAGRAWMMACLLVLPATVASAQVRTVDPNTAIDADLAPGAPAADTAPVASPAAPASAPASADASAVPAGAAAEGLPPEPAAATATNGSTYKKDDVIGAAEGVFGKGAEGLAAMIENILKDQGEPIGYIAGREAGAAVAVGLRYGSGTLTHKIEGKRDVYWTGPSIGFDLGGNAAKTFVLVYNLFDTQDLFKRYPAGEGAVYVIGGFTASYLRSGKVVLIPIRLGVGWRLGVNAGYMKFSEKRRIIPF